MIQYRWLQDDTIQQDREDVLKNSKVLRRSSVTVTEDLSKRWDFATASSGKVYCLRFKAFKDCQFQREIRFHNFHQNPREQAGASKVHEEHQEEQSRAWVSRQLTFFGQDPLFCLELRLLFVSIILLFVSIILVSREFLCPVRSSFCFHLLSVEMF